jgi:hypothetical protein
MVDLKTQWLREARRAAFEDYRREAISTWIAATGNSMRPLIKPGTRMLVEFGASAVEVGDIVLFPLGDLIVAHRIVAQRWEHGARVLIPKGDGEPYCDKPIHLSDVMGVVRALRYGADDPAANVGCVGFWARATARISRQSGRGAALARRVAAVLPDRLRQTALRAIPPFARIAARVLFAPVLWGARIQSLGVHGEQRR